MRIPARCYHYIYVSAPFDKAFKLLAEKEDLALLRVVAKIPLPDGASVEHLDRELDLPTLHVDHLYRIISPHQALGVHIEAYARYDSDWRRRHPRYGAAFWIKYEIDLVSVMLLLTNRDVPKDLEEQISIRAGEFGIDMRVRIVKMWEVPAADLIATGDPALMAWVPLADHTAHELRYAAEVVEATRDRELIARMKILFGLRYLNTEVIDMILTDEILLESSAVRQWMEKGRDQGERDLLRRQLIRKFGPLSPALDDRLHVATPADIERWAERVLTANSAEETLD